MSVPERNINLDEEVFEAEKMTAFLKKLTMEMRDYGGVLDRNKKLPFVEQTLRNFLAQAETLGDARRALQPSEITEVYVNKTQEKIIDDMKDLAQPAANEKCFVYPMLRGTLLAIELNQLHDYCIDRVSEGKRARNISNINAVRALLARCMKVAAVQTLREPEPTELA